MKSVESTLKVQILNAIRAVESAKTCSEAQKIANRYGSAIRRARASGCELSAISFGDRREPLDVLLKQVPARVFSRAICAA
jgi:hypothetical protein